MDVFVLLDGSQETVAACSVAIELARATEKCLIAQSVINRAGIMQLAGYQGYPGLCGSGVFMEAFHSIVEALTAVHESLQLSLAARAEGCGVQVKQNIDIGTFEEVLATRIGSETVLVLADSDQTRSLMRSLRLATPVILVDEQQGQATKITIAADEKCSEKLSAVISCALPALRVEVLNFKLMCLAA